MLIKKIFRSLPKSVFKLSQAIFVVGQLNEFFCNLLLKIKSRVELHQGGMRLLKVRFDGWLFGGTPGVNELTIKCGNLAAGPFNLRTKLWQRLHVALPTFYFFIKNYAIKTFAAFDQFLGKFKVRLGSESETVNEFLNHQLGVFDAL